MLDAFYGAFAPACFALLGLWLVIVQIRLPDWQRSAMHRKRSYGVALHFALPGVMSLVALIDPQDAAFWRVSFAVVALGGAVVLATVGGLPGGADQSANEPASPIIAGQLGMTAFMLAIATYLLIGALAFVGGKAILRVEALLLIVLVFVGFNAAWLLLFDDSSQKSANTEVSEVKAGRDDTADQDRPVPRRGRALPDAAGN